MTNKEREDEIKKEKHNLYVLLEILKETKIETLEMEQIRTRKRGKR